MTSAVRAATTVLLGFVAVCLAAGGVLHGLAFLKAAQVIDRSNLPAFFAGTFKGLWLSESASLLGLGLVFGVIAAQPAFAARRLILLLALTPLACAAFIYTTVGSFFAGHLLSLAGAAALLGGILRPDQRGEPPS